MRELVREAVRGPVEGGVHPGALALVRTQDDIVVVKQGVANRKTAEPLSPQHRFVAAAITQIAVAVIALQLVSEGRLHLTDAVDDHLPSLLRNGSRVTVEQLLTQASGLGNFMAAEGFENLITRRAPRPERLVALADELGPEFRPGSDVGYTPTNFFVLGMIVEKVTGEPLGRLLERRVFRLAGMRDSSLGWTGGSKAPIARGYTDERDVTNSPQAAWAWAAGGIVSNVRDMSAFHEALFGGELLPRQWVRRMTAVQAEAGLNYDLGYGITHWKLRCGRAFGDWGSIPGYQSHAWTLEGLDRHAGLIINSYEISDSEGAATRILEHALCS